MYCFERIRLEHVNADEYYCFPNKNIFTTLPWINFLIEDNPGADPVIIRVSKGGHLVGYFSGLKIYKFRIPIIGSPFNGWGTSWMGLDVFNCEEIPMIYKELIPYLFKECGAMYVSITDRFFSVEDAKKSFKTVSADSLQLIVDKTDDELFKGFKTDCRNFIRQFERRGATAEFVEPNSEFVNEFYSQLIDVFKKQGMVPTWKKSKIETLLKNLQSEGMVLCIQVKDPEGKCIASSIYPGFNKKFFFWAGASYRSGQHFRPNEYMIWKAIQYWRDRGAKEFDMVGIRDYKKKFGPEEIHYASIEIAHPMCLIWAKNCAQKLFYKLLKRR